MGAIKMVGGSVGEAGKTSHLKKNGQEKSRDPAEVTWNFKKN